MNNKEIKNLIKKARKLAKPFRVTDDTFRLKDIDRDKSTEASVASMSEVVSDLSRNCRCYSGLDRWSAARGRISNELSGLSCH